MVGEILGQEAPSHACDTGDPAAAEIVNVPRHTGYERQSVGTHHVPSIGEVARHVQVADAQDGLKPAGLNFSQLAREAGDDETSVVARASVIERSDADNRQLML